MIYEVAVREPGNTPVEWLPKVAYLKARPVKFGPGLTLLYGPNGSGKSTLTKAIARLFHAEQSGAQVFTRGSLGSVTDRGRLGGRSRFRGGLEVAHDGAPVTYFDADQRVGLIGGMAAFDDDFVSDGLETIRSGRASAGQGHLARLNRIFGTKPAPLVDRLKTKDPDDVEKAARAFLKGSVEPNGSLRPTLVLDEPERSLSMPMRADLWNLILRGSLSSQVIVATHDPMVLWFTPALATFVETEPGYVARCREVMDEVRSWERLFGAKPEKEGL